MYHPILLIKYKSRPLWERETLIPERLPKGNALAYELEEIIYSYVNVLIRFFALRKVGMGTPIGCDSYLVPDTIASSAFIWSAKL